MQQAGVRLSTVGATRLGLRARVPPPHFPFKSPSPGPKSHSPNRSSRDTLVPHSHPPDNVASCGVSSRLLSTICHPQGEQCDRAQLLTRLLRHDPACPRVTARASAAPTTG